jgi:hypothetical protein
VGSIGAFAAAVEAEADVEAVPLTVLAPFGATASYEAARDDEEGGFEGKFHGEGTTGEGRIFPQ